MTYEDAIKAACGLNESWGAGENPEYERGQIELICDLFGYQRYGQEPREQVEEDLRKAKERELRGLAREDEEIPVPRSIVREAIGLLREKDADSDVAQALDDWTTRHDDPGVLSEPM